MATVNLGRIKPVFRGAYSGSTAYVVDDIVTHGDESFICIQAHGAGTQATSVTAYWTKLAAKGTDGTDLTSTLTTQGDIVYRDGSGLARLGFGTSGQFLKTQGTGANPVWGTVASAAVVSVGFAENATRYAFSNSADVAIFTVTFVKTLAAAASKIIVQGLIPIRGTSADWSGLYFDCLTSGVTTHNVNDSAAFKGIHMGSAFSATTSGTILINQEWEDTTNLGAATHTFEFGWKTRNAGSDRPALSANPNSSDDARMHQKASTFTFYEVAI